MSRWFRSWWRSTRGLCWWWHSEPGCWHSDAAKSSHCFLGYPAARIWRQTSEKPPGTLFAYAETDKSHFPYKNISWVLLWFHWQQAGLVEACTRAIRSCHAPSTLHTLQQVATHLLRSTSYHFPTWPPPTGTSFVYCWSSTWFFGFIASWTISLGSIREPKSLTYPAARQMQMEPQDHLTHPIHPTSSTQQSEKAVPRMLLSQVEPRH